MKGLGELNADLARMSLHYRRYGFRKTLDKLLLQLLAKQLPAASKDNYSLPFIFPLNVMACKEQGRRINLLLPSIERRHVYGGIATALTLFEKIAPYFDKARLVITDSPGGDCDYANFKNYDLIFINDRQAKTLEVGPADLFIATAWWSAYILQSVLTWQQAEYAKPQSYYFYLIQDFEPGFYAWSSLYALAETTYRTPHPTIALFNTEGLKQYFEVLGYQFFDSVAFNPPINRNLLRGMKAAQRHSRRCPYQIIIYGRPSVDRNCFPLLIEAIRIWRHIFPNYRNWSIISAGEAHPDISLEDGLCIRAAGKLNLDDYQKLLYQSSVGLSMMISPHPSYPPLEMAAYGLEVVTNKFGNKDLSHLSGNITSVELITPENIANALADACRCVEARQGKPSLVTEKLIGAGSDYDVLIERIKCYF